jgi:hypothetical protein
MNARLAPPWAVKTWQRADACLKHKRRERSQVMPEDDHNLPPSDTAPTGSAPSDAAAVNTGSNEEAIAPDVLKSAYNAFKKRWKLTRLDYESRIGRGPLSAGSRSAIVGIEPPKEFPRAVWDELVKQGRVKRAGSGLYSMP